MITLFCTDFDNTLGRNGRISKENVAAIKSLQKNNISFALVTGRIASNAQAIMKRYGLHAHVIATNGAIALYEGEEAVFSHPIPVESVKKIVEDCRENHRFFFIYDDHRCFIPKGVYPYLQRTFFLDQVSRICSARIISMDWDMRQFYQENTQALKINLFPPKKQLQALRERYQKDSALYVTWSNSISLEIMAKGVNKWEGIQALCAKLGMSADQVAAIGDQNNDLPMLRKAGFAFAVGNAKQEVKEASDVIVSSMKENGVKEAIAIVLAANREEKKGGIKSIL